MWVNNDISRPLRYGKYKVLVDYDGLGNLKEYEDDFYNGEEWSLYDSNAQYICFWEATEGDYKIIADKIEKEMETTIKNTEVGNYQIENIKINTTYTITHLEGEEPKIENNEN